MAQQQFWRNYKLKSETQTDDQPLEPFTSYKNQLAEKIKKKCQLEPIDINLKNNDGKIELTILFRWSKRECLKEEYQERFEKFRDSYKFDAHTHTIPDIGCMPAYCHLIGEEKIQKFFESYKMSYGDLYEEIYESASHTPKSSCAII